MNDKEAWVRLYEEINDGTTDSDIIIGRTNKVFRAMRSELKNEATDPVKRVREQRDEWE